VTSKNYFTRKKIVLKPPWHGDPPMTTSSAHRSLGGRMTIFQSMS
jgi:hypothetical protein